MSKKYDAIIIGGGSFRRGQTEAHISWLSATDVRLMGFYLNAGAFLSTPRHGLVISSFMEWLIPDPSAVIA